MNLHEQSVTQPVSEEPDGIVQKTVDALANSYSRGQQKPPDAAGIDPSSLFSSRYLLAMASDLALPEIATLLQAETPRAEGLRYARQGDLDTAEDLLRQARESYSSSQSSAHARAAGDTFQSAAESYVLYRRQLFDDAIESMTAALSAARVLTEQHGYDMEFRRVHLARNISRVHTLAGAHTKAAALIAGLLRYIDPGATRTWPIENSAPWPAQRVLIVPERVWSCDELVRDMDAARSRGIDLLGEVRRVLGDYHPESDEVLRVSLWSETVTAATRCQFAALQQAGCSFLDMGSGGMTYAWRSAIAAIRRMCQAHGAKVGIFAADDGAIGSVAE